MPPRLLLGEDHDTSPHGYFGGQGFIGVAADELGLDQAALLEELASGKTITKIAEERGVSRCQS